MRELKRHEWRAPYAGCRNVGTLVGLHPLFSGRWVAACFTLSIMMRILFALCPVLAACTAVCIAAETKTNKVIASNVTRENPWTNSLGMAFVPVPGTEVLFGVWDVRVRDFEAFVKETGHDASGSIKGIDASGLMYSLSNRRWGQHGDTWKNPGFSQGSDHPVVGVNWDDAKAFCTWLTKKERAGGRITNGQSYRLPADWEWSVAVGLQEGRRGTPSSKNAQIKGEYPWGTSWPPPSGTANYGSSPQVDAYENTSPVGSFHANRNGLYDMGGNVWQWCEDWCDGKQQFRVLRGASWFDSYPDYLLSSFRTFNSPVVRVSIYGFRCVLEGASARRDIPEP